MLPDITTIEQYRAFDLRGADVQSATREVFAHLRLPVNRIEFPQDGSSPVALVDGTRVLKLFAPLFSDAFAAEAQSLTLLSRLTGVAPALIATGTIHGWSYVVMSQLAGHSLKSLWPGLSRIEIESACHAVGASLKRIHALSISRDEFKSAPWPRFLEGQKAACVQRHEKLGLDPALVAQIPGFLESVGLSVNDSTCFLHTEVMRDHVFFKRTGGEISFSGFIDFEPSMIGAAEYDFASVGIFLSSGDATALRSFFAGYGILGSVDREFRRRVMAYALLHKYSNLKRYLEFMPNASSLDELAELWWAT